MALSSIEKDILAKWFKAFEKSVPSNSQQLRLVEDALVQRIHEQSPHSKKTKEEIFSDLIEFLKNPTRKWGKDFPKEGFEKWVELAGLDMKKILEKNDHILKTYVPTENWSKYRDEEWIDQVTALYDPRESLLDPQNIPVNTRDLGGKRMKEKFRDPLDKLQEKKQIVNEVSLDIKRLLNRHVNYINDYFDLDAYAKLINVGSNSLQYSVKLTLPISRINIKGRSPKARACLDLVNLLKKYFVQRIKILLDESPIDVETVDCKTTCSKSIVTMNVIIYFEIADGIFS